MWIWISVVSLAANTAKVLIVKRLCGGIDSRQIVLVGRLFSGVVLLPMLWMRAGGIPTDGLFWAVVLAAAVITAFASVLFTEAVKKGPLSLVIPAQAAVPVFTLLTLWLLRRESPPPLAVGLMAMSMTAVGWMLYAGHHHENKTHRQTVYALLSLVAAILFGISTVLDRVAIARVAYGALAYSACWNLTSAALIGLAMLRTGIGRPLLLPQRRDALPLALYGLSVLAAFFTQQLAVQESLDVPGGVVNVKSVVMLHLPVVLLVGVVVFRERIGRWALAAGILALVFGAALVRTML